MSDIFSRDPFKGTDPFSSDALFGQPSPKPFGDLPVPAESRPFNCQFSGWVKEPILSEDGKESTVLLVFEADSPTGDEPVRRRALSAVEPDPLAPSQRIEGSSVSTDKWFAAPWCHISVTAHCICLSLSQNDSSSTITVTPLPEDLEGICDSCPGNSGGPLSPPPPWFRDSLYPHGMQKPQLLKRRLSRSLP